MTMFIEYARALETTKYTEIFVKNTDGKVGRSS
jgi:hypothetical protein